MYEYTYHNALFLVNQVVISLVCKPDSKKKISPMGNFPQLQLKPAFLCLPANTLR